MAVPPTIEIEPQPFAIVRPQLPSNRRRAQTLFVSVLQISRNLKLVNLRLWLILPNGIFNHIGRGPHACEARFRRNALEKLLQCH